MEIIVAGAGKVGYKLAETLSSKHNVYVVDKNPQALEAVEGVLDILPIFGDIQDPDTYKRLGRKKFDIFIAVTNSDEVNILSTLIADDVIEVKKRIIRLKNPYFAKSSIASKIGIDEAVFPYLQTAHSISTLLKYPYLDNLKEIPFSSWKLFSLKTLTNLGIPIAFEREGKLFFSNEFKEGDLIYFLGKELPVVDSKRLKVALFGGDIEVVKLIKGKVDLKIIEEDPTLCQKLSEIVQEEAIVINSKYLEDKLFTQEKLKEADIVITTSQKDEENIVKSLEAKEYGVKKCIAVNNENRYYDLMHKLSITPVRGPKTTAYYDILEKISSTEVIGEKHFCGGRGSVLVRKISTKAKLPKLPKTVGSFWLLREEKAEKLKEKMELKEGDLIVVFTLSELEEELKRWILKI